MAREVKVESGPVGPVVRPPNPTEAVLLYLHGNQDLSGLPQSALDRVEHLALLTGATVVCPRYRLPTALEDVRTWYRYSQDAGPVVLAGERIGAALAVTLLLRLRDSGAPLPRCTLLVSALLDFGLQAKSLILGANINPAFGIPEPRRSVGRHTKGAGDAGTPLSPLQAPLHGLTPLQLLVAGTTVDLRIRPDAASLQAETVTAMADFIGAWSPPAPGKVA